jgi:hypothetical protein
MYAGIIDGPARWLRSLLSMTFLAFALQHLQIDMAIPKTTRPATMMTANSALVKPGMTELDDVEVAVGDVVVLVGDGFEPAVAVTPPAPVLAGLPVTAAVANPPKGVTEVPPYWLT